MPQIRGVRQVKKRNLGSYAHDLVWVSEGLIVRGDLSVLTVLRY